MTWKGKKPNELYAKKCSNCGYKGFLLGDQRFCHKCEFELELCEQSELPVQLVEEHVEYQRGEKERKKELWQSYLESLNSVVNEESG